MIAPDSQSVMPVFGSSMAGVPRRISIRTRLHVCLQIRKLTAVGVEADEWLLLQDGEVHVLSLVRNVQLLQDDGDLPWVGALQLDQ